MCQLTGSSIVLVINVVQLVLLEVDGIPRGNSIFNSGVGCRLGECVIKQNLLVVGDFPNTALRCVQTHHPFDLSVLRVKMVNQNCIVCHDLVHISLQFIHDCSRDDLFAVVVGNVNYFIVNIVVRIAGVRGSPVYLTLVRPPSCFIWVCGHLRRVILNQKIVVECDHRSMHVVTARFRIGQLSVLCQ